MNRYRHNDAEGPPDIQLATLSVWVRGRQFPDSQDYWDVNWLNVSIQVKEPGAFVRVEGPILAAWEVAQLVDGCRRLYESLTGEFELKCLEPYFRLAMKMSPLGRMYVAVDLTPDHLHQRHRFEFNLDQSYLPAFIHGVEALLQAFPVQGSPEKS